MSSRPCPKPLDGSDAAQAEVVPQPQDAKLAEGRRWPVAAAVALGWCICFWGLGWLMLPAWRSLFNVGHGNYAVGQFPRCQIPWLEWTAASVLLLLGIAVAWHAVRSARGAAGKLVCWTISLGAVLPTVLFGAYLVFAVASVCK